MNPENYPQRFEFQQRRMTHAHNVTGVAVFRTMDPGYRGTLHEYYSVPAVKNLMYCTRGVAAIARTLRHQFPLPLSRPPADVTPLILEYSHHLLYQSALIFTRGKKVLMSEMSGEISL